MYIDQDEIRLPPRISEASAHAVHWYIILALLFRLTSSTRPSLPNLRYSTLVQL